MLQAAIEDCQVDWLGQDFGGVLSTGKANVGLSQQGNDQLQIKKEKTTSYSSSLLRDGSTLPGKFFVSASVAGHEDPG